MTDITRRLQQIEEIVTHDLWVETADFMDDTLHEYIEPHYVTGRLERNIYAEPIPGGGVVGGISDDGMMVDSKYGPINYGNFLDKGTSDHWVGPKNKQALMWSNPSGDYYSKGHTVSGIKASNFIQKTEEDTLAEIPKILTRLLQTV